MSRSPAAAADVATVSQARRLRGRLTMPPDKSISHRALLLAAMATGRSRVWGASTADDPTATAACLAALGAELVAVARTDDPVDPAKGRVDWAIDSPGWKGWRHPGRTLDCANSGTTMRLLTGLIAGSRIESEVRLDGDASLRGRPMGRVVEPLTEMGATVVALGSGGRPPIAVTGGRRLRGIAWTPAVPSAQVKSSLLLAGLAADGRTEIREAVATRDHTERMLRARGVAVESRLDPGSDDWCVSVEGGQAVGTSDCRVPGDLSAAAFWLVAGAAHPDAELRLERVGVNPSRRAAIDLLRAMGARIDQETGGEEADDPAVDDPAVEPEADLVVRSSRLEAIDMTAADVARAIDEIPVLCLAAACARGVTHIHGAGELRHKESDRLAGIVAGLRAIGVRVELDGDELTIEGGGERLGCGLRGAEVASLGDHRLVMTFAVAGLIATGQMSIEAAAASTVSYPGFFRDLEGVRA